ncbi:hypothetical protein MUK42_22281 [Musa troglodytarum]|uniref:Uncharacterized protein n=1 Tax=Musa troglodytarum TaxID=320322 RepID=A0A9E7L7X1_9LILI|nr:hypothetical protein MUK42_22281 [Musa troglodytarum]
MVIPFSFTITVVLGAGMLPFSGKQIGATFFLGLGFRCEFYYFFFTDVVWVFFVVALLVFASFADFVFFLVSARQDLKTSRFNSFLFIRFPSIPGRRKLLFLVASMAILVKNRSTHVRMRTTMLVNAILLGDFALHDPPHWKQQMRLE